MGIGTAGISLRPIKFENSLYISIALLSSYFGNSELAKIIGYEAKNIEKPFMLYWLASRVWGDSDPMCFGLYRWVTGEEGLVLPNVSSGSSYFCNSYSANGNLHSCRLRPAVIVPLSNVNLARIWSWNKK